MRKENLSYRILSSFVAFVFIFSLITPPAQAQVVLNLPVPGVMITPTANYTPTIIRGLTINPDNALAFDFIVDKGDENLQGEVFNEKAQDLIKYFLAGLTVPKEEMWVNLSPYESDRIIPDGFGDTKMGRDMLAQDYMLKQLTASLMYPENELGRNFWNRVYTKVQEQFDTVEIPVNTFNKVWILPKKVVVYEKDASVFVLESHLKVMLEEDYVALNEGVENSKYGLDFLEQRGVEKVNAISSGIVRDVLIPEIEREVNEGKTFANLRQIFNSIILAEWYKKNLKESLLGQVYVNKQKTKGVDTEDKEINQKIYNQYVEAFKKGVYNYIKEDVDPNTQKLIPRKYFSGGTSASPLDIIVSSEAMVGNIQEILNHNHVKVSSVFLENGDAYAFVSSPIGNEDFVEKNEERFDRNAVLSKQELLDKIVKQYEYFDLNPIESFEYIRQQVTPEMMEKVLRNFTRAFWRTRDARIQRNTVHFDLLFQLPGYHLDDARQKVGDVFGGITTEQSIESLKDSLAQLLIGKLHEKLRNFFVYEEGESEDIINDIFGVEQDIVGIEQALVYHFSNNFQQMQKINQKTNSWKEEVYELAERYYDILVEWEKSKEEERSIVKDHVVFNEIKNGILLDEVYSFVRWLFPRIYNVPRLKDIDKPIITVLSGPPASGKETLVELISKKLSIPTYFSTKVGARAVTRKALEWVLGASKAKKIFPEVMQHSFEGKDIESFYAHSLTAMISLESNLKRLLKENTSAVIEGVALVPGFLSEEYFEKANIVWINLDVRNQLVHKQRFEGISDLATRKKYIFYKDRIFEINNLLRDLAERSGFINVDNTQGLHNAVNIIESRIVGPYADRGLPIYDKVRDEMKEELMKRRQFLAKNLYMAKDKGGESSSPVSKETLNLLFKDSAQRQEVELEIGKIMDAYKEIHVEVFSDGLWVSWFELPYDEKILGFLEEISKNKIRVKVIRNFIGVQGGNQISEESLDYQSNIRQYLSLVNKFHKEHAAVTQEIGNMPLKYQEKIVLDIEWRLQSLFMLAEKIIKIQSEKDSTEKTGDIDNLFQNLNIVIKGSQNVGGIREKFNEVLNEIHKFALYPQIINVNNQDQNEFLHKSVRERGGFLINAVSLDESGQRINLNANDIPKIQFIGDDHISGGISKEILFLIKGLLTAKADDRFYNFVQIYQSGQSVFMYFSFGALHAGSIRLYLADPEEGGQISFQWREGEQDIGNKRGIILVERFIREQLGFLTDITVDGQGVNAVFNKNTKAQSKFRIISMASRLMIFFTGLKNFAMQYDKQENMMNRLLPADQDRLLNQFLTYAKINERGFPEDLLYGAQEERARLLINIREQQTIVNSILNKRLDSLGLPMFDLEEGDTLGRYLINKLYVQPILKEEEQGILIYEKGSLRRKTYDKDLVKTYPHDSTLWIKGVAIPAISSSYGVATGKLTFYEKDMVFDRTMIMSSEFMRPDMVEDAKFSGGVLTTKDSPLNHAQINLRESRLPSIIGREDEQYFWSSDKNGKYLSVMYREPTQSRGHLKIDYNQRVRRLKVYEGDVVRLVSKGKNNWLMVPGASVDKKKDKRKHIRRVYDLLVKKDFYDELIFYIKKIRDKEDQKFLIQFILQEVLVTGTVNNKDESINLVLSILKNFSEFNLELRKHMGEVFKIKVSDYREKIQNLMVQISEVQEDYREFLFWFNQALMVLKEYEGYYHLAKNLSLDIETLNDFKLTLQGLYSEKVPVFRMKALEKVLQLERNIDQVRIEDFGMVLRIIDSAKALQVQNQEGYRKAVEDLERKIVLEQKKYRHKFVINLNDSGSYLRPFIGGKAAEEGELMNMVEAIDQEKGILSKDQIPAGFTITAYGIEKLLKENAWSIANIEKIVKDDSLNLNEKIKTVEEALVENTQIPKALESVIIDELRAIGSPQFVLVRSSSIHEDTKETAMAGRFESFSYVEGIEQIKYAMLSSLAHYWSVIGRIDAEQPMLIQEQIPADAAAIGFSININNQRWHEAVVSAGFGMGEGLVSGKVESDLYKWDKRTMVQTKETVRPKYHRIVFDDESKSVFREGIPSLEGLNAVLTKEHQKEITQALSLFEEFFGYPVDIEVVIHNGKIYYVQVRPVTGIPFNLDQLEIKKILKKNISEGKDTVSSPISQVSSKIKNLRSILGKKFQKDTITFNKISDKQLAGLLLKYKDNLKETRDALIKLKKIQYDLLVRLSRLEGYHYDPARKRLLEMIYSHGDSFDSQVALGALKRLFLPEIINTIKGVLKEDLDILSDKVDKVLGKESSADEVMAKVHQLMESVEANDKEQEKNRIEGIMIRWEAQLKEEIDQYAEDYVAWRKLEGREKSLLYQDESLQGVRLYITEQSLHKIVRWLFPRVYDAPHLKDLDKPTIILVAGTSGTGKSTISQNLVNTLGIPTYFSTDVVGRQGVREVYEWLLGKNKSREVFPEVYGSSFDQPTLNWYYGHSLLTIQGVEGVLDQLIKDNKSAIIEGVPLIPGLLPEEYFERANIVWMVSSISDKEEHFNRYAGRDAVGVDRGGAQRYRDKFKPIRNIHDRLVEMANRNNSFIIDNKDLSNSLKVAYERAADPFADRGFFVIDRIRNRVEVDLNKRRNFLRREMLSEKIDLQKDSLKLDSLDTYYRQYAYATSSKEKIKALRSIADTLIRIHKIKGVAFDLGGVLLLGHNKIVVKEFVEEKLGLTLSDEEVEKIHRNIYKSEPVDNINYSALKIGRATEEQFAAHALSEFNKVLEVNKRYPVNVEEYTQIFLDFYYDHYEIVEENFEIIKALIEADVKIYGLTNNFWGKLSFLQEKFPVLKILKMIVSQDVGVSKPGKGIYSKLVDMLGSAEVLFFDDKIKNTRAWFENFDGYGIVYDANTSALLENVPEIREFFDKKMLENFIQMLEEIQNEETKASQAVVQVSNKLLVEMRGMVSSSSLGKQVQGGINFNTDLIDWQIKRDGNGVPLPMNLQSIEYMQIDGFVPVIINVTPVSLPIFLGLNNVDCPDDGSKNTNCLDGIDPVAKLDEEVLL
ncbi:hypothetical protein MNBD_UNCLBAC01-937 [hydrothermal vent metagenome]|uniref:pyruvate, water dikinase n=1 Tax=hydrothermal vent metagenome TaxID=652676 RepID=A0A3B1D8M3_9ZZZZ